MGLRGLIPIGGHCLPNSSLVTKMEWQNTQKDPSKKNASDAMNRITAYLKPFWTAGVVALECAGSDDISSLLQWD